jgi:hypothetical protein
LVILLKWDFFLLIYSFCSFLLHPSFSVILVDCCGVVARSRFFYHTSVNTDIHPFVGFEVFTTVTVKNAVYWDLASCESYKNDVSEKRDASSVLAKF